MDVRSLTQQEAEERAALLSVDRYDIDVDLTDLPTGAEVRCVSRVRFTCRRPGEASFADCAATVVAATLNGAPLPAPERGRLTLPDLAETNTLVVETVQANTTEGEGVHKAVDPADGEVYLWMSFEPDEARFVWACFDQPDLKAPHAFTVTAPTAWTVVSNSGYPRVETVAAGEEPARRWIFSDTPPLSTYNPVVLAGPFHEIRREAGGYDLGIYARRSLRSVLERDAEWIFTVTEQGLGFFGEVFAMPFPQQSYDQVFVPELGGAMENYGAVTWSDTFLRRSEPTFAEQELFAKVLLHEMAHMWFGNIVTMRWWDDLWLNEAFAEFACNWAAVRATEYADAWASHLADDKLGAYLADRGPGSHPIHQPITDVEQAASIFDAITYPKGASVLAQLMTYVGEEAFTRGMAAYFAEHAWENTRLQDLMDALAAASGRDLDSWRAAWLETAGTDTLTLRRQADEHVLVADGPGGAHPRPHVLAVGSYRRTPEGLERVARTEVEVAGRETPLELPEADLHLVNDDDLTFAVVRPDDGSRGELLAAAAELPTAISRGVAGGTVWDMLTTGEATAVEAVRCLTSVLRVESSPAVVEPYLALAADAAELWAPPSARDALQAEVADTCRALAEDPDRRRVALRTLARTAGSVAEVDRLLEQAGDDVDLRWRALVRRAQLGEVGSRDVETLLERDPDPDAWVRALLVTAARPTPEAKEEAWQTAVEERKVPVGSMGMVGRAFWRPGQDEVLAPYAQRFLEALPRFHEGGMIPAMVYTERMFPCFALPQGFLDRVVEAAAETAPVVHKTALESADLVRRMLAGRAAG